MKTRNVMIFGCLVILFVTTSFAQSWSKEQTEVWGAVETAWKTMGDVDAFRTLIDDNYRGWTIGDLAPFTKQETISWLEWNTKKYKVEFYKIHPLAIDVYDDIAIVFYSFQTLVVKVDGTGDGISSSGRWMDIYRKNDARWLLIADYGGKIPD